MSETTETTPEARVAESALRCLDRALAAMNRAVELTRDHGPAVGMESIADFLNDTDGIDEEVADTTPDNWLTRWTVVDLTGLPVTAVPPPTDLAAWLTELEAARAAATPGPWEQDGEYRAEVYNGAYGDAERLVADCHTAADAALIVAAVNALPRLLAAVRAALDLADRWEQFAVTRLTGIDARHMRAAAHDVRRYVTEALTPERTTP